MFVAPSVATSPVFDMGSEQVRGFTHLWRRSNTLIHPLPLTDIEVGQVVLGEDGNLATR